MPTDVTSCQI